MNRKEKSLRIRGEWTCKQCNEKFYETTQPTVCKCRRGDFYFSGSREEEVVKITVEGVHYETICDENNNVSFAFLTESGSPNITAFVDDEDKNIRFVPIFKKKIMKKDATVVIFPEIPVEYGSDSELVHEIKSFIHRYLDISSEHEMFATQYILLSWVYEALTTIPYLSARGDFSTGKSRYLDTIGDLCYLPIHANGATTDSPIFRLIGTFGGTLVAEEIDKEKSDTTQMLTKIINLGYEKKNSILRSDKEDPNEIESFNVFGPKVFSRRFEFQDKATESRCITELMCDTTREDIPIQLPQKFFEEQKVLRNKLLMFRLRNLQKVDPNAIEKIRLPKQLDSRIRQGLASFAILFHNNEEIFTQFLDFAKKHQLKIKEELSTSIEGQIAQFLFDYKEAPKEQQEKIQPQLIAKCLSEKSNKPLTPNFIGVRLKSLGVKTVQGHEEEGGKRKTIRHIVWDEPLFERIFLKYLPEYWIEKNKDYFDTEAQSLVPAVPNVPVVPSSIHLAQAAQVAQPAQRSPITHETDPEPNSEEIVPRELI
ncbi:MAG: hypothetical protein Q8P05_06070 [Candidatus Diapherotrites archaeon]|nr:hypothetical protein [Candidatus Diapherotrites archaeon]